MKLLKSLFLTAAITPLFSFPVKAFTVTVEEPAIQAEQLTEDLFFVDFNDLTVDSTDSFSKANSSTASTYTYSDNLAIRSTNIFGGADNTSYIEPINGSDSFSMSVDNPQKYFGFWWSAGDASNVLTFKKEGSVVATFNTADVISTISTLPNGSDYYCNPTASFAGEVCSEPYVFINFFFEGTEAYDEIVFEATNVGGNFESDNHTFSVNAQPVRGEIVTTNPPVIVFAD